ncbi:hypothetical protein LMH63_18560 [Spiribacter halobius]|nr:hypothetical protein [Spiribacter halobius]UEX79936.1 hypothetical protein LMH63_18560 [Spiribacter halobius]
MQFGPDAGEREFSIAGSGSSDQDFDNSNFGLTADLGWYLQRNVIAGIRQSVNFADIQGEDATNDFWNGTTRGYLDYQFGTHRARPFIGASLGGIYGDGVDDSAFAGLETGLKYYVLEKTYILGRLDYQFFFESGSGADEGFEDGAWAYTVGMGYNF